jgi:hypothetical protein
MHYLREESAGTGAWVLGEFLIVSLSPKSCPPAAAVCAGITTPGNHFFMVPLQSVRNRGAKLVRLFFENVRKLPIE